MRLGMVGTDLLHALEYAALINSPDSDAPAKPVVDHGAAVGGMPQPSHLRPDAWDPAPTTGRDLRRDPAFGDARVVSWWGQDAQQAQLWARRAGVETVAATNHDQAHAVDAALICTWHGQDHAALARPYLAAGKPVFIDKPLTESAPEAADLAALAERNGTFLFTSSPWRWSPAVVGLREDLHELGELCACAVTGPDLHGPYFYTVHLVETALSLFGPGVTSVRAVETPRARVVIASYPDGRVLTLTGVKGSAALRNVTVTGSRGQLGCDVTDAQKDAGMVLLLRTFLQSVRTQRAPEPHAAAIETVAVLDAAAVSATKGGTPVEVALDGVLGRGNDR